MMQEKGHSEILEGEKSVHKEKNQPQFPSSKYDSAGYISRLFCL